MLLDKTIFYPQGGGQPSDTGKIFLDANDWFEVAKVVKFEKEVRHYGEFYHIDNSSMQCEDNVKLVVDAEKRIQNVKLHSTAHLLDFAVSELSLGWVADKGYSFPDGPYVNYIAEATITPELIIQIENKVNELRLQNLDFVQVLTQSEGQGVNRTMQIQGQNNVSSCDCGGTHINNTRELPPIKVRKITCKKGIVKLSYELL